MELTLYRRPSTEFSTIGVLHVDGSFQCYTLEDVVREMPGLPVSAWKVPGETAIPAGRYRVTITRSNRFKKDLPLLNGVPGFSGVRIHPGNTHHDTEGCILPGMKVAGDTVVESRVAFQALMEWIDGALLGGDEVWINVLNPMKEETTA